VRWELLLFLLGLAATLFGCLVPLSWLPPLPNDKLMHFGAFGTMALLAGRMMPTPLTVALALLGVLVLSWLVELLQNLVPGRHFCWRDMAANAAGVLCAGAVLSLV